ncbi:MAG: hypothetical protein ISS47_05880 [Candidatus Omnitrophica bacterium]|nr:hypothetical protein [Candidatus Omnitrophota bacterium]
MVNTSFKIGFYYTHYQCLGHTTRVLTLLKIIKEKFPAVKLFSFEGSTPQTFLRFPKYIKTHSLPFPLFSLKDFRINYKFNNRTIIARTNYLLNLIKRIDLDILVTEYFPLGRNICKHELLPSLYYLRKVHRSIISSAGYPLIPKVNAIDLDFFFHFYKKIFIHSPDIEVRYIADSYKEKRERKEYLDIFKRHESKITFTGYIIPSQLKFNEESKGDIALKKDKINILVTRGAGAYYLNIVTASIKASDLLDNNFYFTIITGPATSKKEWEYFKYLMDQKVIKNAVLIKCSSQIRKLIKNCHLCISPASYNTSTILLYFRKDSIIIPFEGYKNMYYREQPSRANLLKDFIGSSIIRYGNLTPKKLAKEIKKKTTGINSLYYKRIENHWFKGREVFLEEFQNL